MIRAATLTLVLAATALGAAEVEVPVELVEAQRDRVTMTVTGTVSVQLHLGKHEWSVLPTEGGGHADGLELLRYPSAHLLIDVQGEESLIVGDVEDASSGDQTLQWASERSAGVAVTGVLRVWSPHRRETPEDHQARKLRPRTGSETRPCIFAP